MNIFERLFRKPQINQLEIHKDQVRNFGGVVTHETTTNTGDPIIRNEFDYPAGNTQIQITRFSQKHPHSILGIFRHTTRSPKPRS